MKRFLHNENGATAIEYCLIASLIGFVLVGAFTTIGGNLSAIFTSLAAVF